MSYQKRPKRAYERKSKVLPTPLKRRLPRTGFPYDRPRRVRPMLAEKGSSEDVKRKEMWGQRKYDGTRIIIIKNGDRIIMRGRSWINDYAPRFPKIVDDLRKLPVKRCVIEGELTFFKGRGRDEFLTALASPNTIKERAVVPKAMMFDVLFMEDYDLRGLPFEERDSILKDLIPSELPYVDKVVTKKSLKDKRSLKEKVARLGGEGLMLKKDSSPYREGVRSDEWLKIKDPFWDTDDAVVVGYTVGKGARANTFGSLILAQKTKKGWQHVGNTSGFKEQEMARLLKKMARLKILRSPLVDEVPSSTKVQSWVKPKIVVEVRFSERFLKSKRFRNPDYVKERYDKSPHECLLK